MPLVQNNAKRKLAAGGMVLGFGLHHLRSMAAPMLAAATGHDYMSMDMEHGAFTVQEATQLCIAALNLGMTPIVRVCAGALDEATRLLDNGALGIVVPHVDTAKQARRIAAAFHYPPMGHRSWGGPPAVYGYVPPDVGEAQQAINDEVLTIAMIESPEGVENADDIAEVEGIDVLLIGSFDLTTELGIPGQMGHSKLIDAYATVAAACRKHGKVLGMGGINNREDARRYVGMGARYLGSGTDHSYIMQAARSSVEFYRGLTVGETAENGLGKKKKDGQKKG
jgi:2-keto-3-deoxy-L-rhamnonate aldolase RhmA